MSDDLKADSSGWASQSRRQFLQITAVAGLVSTAPVGVHAASAGAAPARSGTGAQGWEWGPMRWAQVAFTEDDPQRYDPKFWFDYFRRIHADGACLSAGGVTAFYPTKVPFHARSPYLGDRDMFGEMVKGCRDLGMRVLARVDPHAMRDDALKAHPEWVARAADGTPRPHPTAPDLYLTCPNGGMNFEFMPAVIKEIMDGYKVDAIFGNRWNGSAGTCYCDTCKTEFRAASGFEIANLNQPAVRRAYTAWDAEKRFAQIKLWNDVIQAANPAAFFAPGTTNGLDPARLRTTVRALYNDRQGRSGQRPAWENGKNAKETRAIMHGKPIAGIFSIGFENTHRWKDSTQSDAEIIGYVQAGIAQGMSPWITKFKAEVFDTRWMAPVEQVFSWHWRNEAYFRHTDNLARVAILQGGSANALDGFYQALLESKIPFEIVDSKQISPEDIDRYRVLVLPNIISLSDLQCGQLRGYVARGGRIVATHQTSLQDETGRARPNFGLADLFGCDYAGKVDSQVQNSYLTVRGPHPLLRGLEKAGRVIGGIDQVRVTPVDPSAQPLTLVPSYPDLPMERVFTSQLTTNMPGVFARTVGKGRVVYFAMNIDETFWEVQAADHLALLRNAVEWAADEPQPLVVDGRGLLDVALWRQQNSMTAHLVNLQNPMTMRGYYREFLPTGAYRVSLALPAGAKVKSVKLLEAARSVKSRVEGGRLVVEVPGVLVHEVVAVDLI
ncbi:MAG: Beta-galactosidase trimerization domain protein [Caulobacteraceae bacterium]|nr:Beta-galactosidase trimerization domain protein [Caulobacteraceae bacterium]